MVLCHMINHSVHFFENGVNIIVVTPNGGSLGSPAILCLAVGSFCNNNKSNQRNICQPNQEGRVH